MRRFEAMAERVADAAATLYGAVAAAGNGLKVRLSFEGMGHVEYVGRAVDSWERVDFGPADRHLAVPVTYSVHTLGAKADALEPGRSSRISVQIRGAGNEPVERLNLTLRMGSDSIRSAEEFLAKDVPKVVSDFVASNPEKIGEGAWSEIQKSYGPGSRSGD